MPNDHTDIPYTVLLPWFHPWFHFCDLTLLELATLVGVQDLAAQVCTVVKVPLVAHVVLPPPEYPMSQVTVTVLVVVPVLYKNHLE